MVSNLIPHAKILIVDDELANVRLLQRILTRAGYHHIMVTTDPRHAVTMFADDQPDLVLLDLHMPHLSGLEVMAEFNKMIAAEDYVPVIILTADATPEAKRRALSTGARDFMCKPFDNVEVALRITNFLRTRFLHRALRNQNLILDERVKERTSMLEATVEELRKTQQQVVQQERLRALGMMSTGIAHDFNNLLSLILGYSELLLNESANFDDSGKAIKYLQTIIGAAQDGAQMVNRLAEFQRPPAEGDLRRSISLARLINQVVELTMPRWRGQALASGTDINVVMELDDVPGIAGDPAEFRELLTNLIFNAVDAMPTGGTITLRTRLEKDSVLLEVEDTGTGMNDEVRQRCLEPFFTTKGRKGSGLGLALIYGIIQRHNGDLAIDTKPGEGTKFRIRFPAQEFSAPEEIKHTEETYRPLNILVVDDQPVLCEVLAEYLQSDWHKVTTAQTGDDAIAKFRDGNFDLVLTDKAMPGLTGEQLAAELRTISPDVPIILLTGFAENGISDSVSPGIDAVIGKPVDRTTLRRAISQAIARRDQADTPAGRPVSTAGIISLQISQPVGALQTKTV